MVSPFSSHHLWMHLRWAYCNKNHLFNLTQASLCSFRNKFARFQSNMFHTAENWSRVETCSSGNNCWNMIFLPSSCPCRSKGPPCRPHHHPLGRFSILPRRHSLPCPLQQRDHTESLWKKAHRRPHQWQTEASTPWAIGPPLPRNGPPSLEARDDLRSTRTMKSRRAFLHLKQKGISDRTITWIWKIETKMN